MRIADLTIAMATLRRGPRAGLYLAPPTHDSEAEPPDIVVPVRAGANNEYLRFALRSWAANLPHERVWIVGYKPPWLTNVRHIPTSQGASKYRNTTLAMRAACEHPEVSDPFLWLMDDVFTMRPVRFLPVFHRGKVAEVDAYYRRRRLSGAYLRGMRETRDLLARLGFHDIYSFEVHAPLPVEKAGMLRALKVGARLSVPHKRTLYAVLNELGGERIRDPKVIGRGNSFPRDATYLSTMPSSFSHGAVGEFIRERFPTQCRYEVPGSQPRPPRPGVYGTRQASARTRRR